MWAHSQVIVFIVFSVRATACEGRSVSLCLLLSSGYSYVLLRHQPTTLRGVIALLSCNFTPQAGKNPFQPMINYVHGKYRIKGTPLSIFTEDVTLRTAISFDLISSVVAK